MAKQRVSLYIVAVSESEKLAAALSTACAKYAIGEDDSFLVLALVDRPERSWPGCCGSGCEPCMNDICDAALMVKKAIAAE